MKIGKVCAMSLALGLGAVCTGAAAPPMGQSGAAGSVLFMNGKHPAQAWFSARSGVGSQPAGGVYFYAERQGRTTRWYYASLTCVEAGEATATFSGPVLHTNEPAWEGQWVQVWVSAGGSPGPAGDRIGAQFFAGPGCLPFQDPPAWIDALGGNLVVYP